MAEGQPDQAAHRRITRVVVAALAVGLTAFVSPAGALAGTLDQSQPNAPVHSAFGAERGAAQTFTAGLTGQLDQADVNILRATDTGGAGQIPCTGGSGVTVEIQSVTGGAPSDTVLATATIPVVSTPTSGAFVSVVFPAPAAVTAGTQYALVLSPPDAPMCGDSAALDFPYSWGAVTDTNPYAGGSPWLKDPGFGGGWTLNGANNDHAFKTYVVPSPDPPPPDGTTPPPDGTTPPPTPSEFTRTLSTSYSEKKDKFKGRLASQSPACISGQKVKVFEEEKGKDPKLGSVPSLASGKYSLEEKNAEGKFYAKVKQTSIGGATCLAAQSKMIKVG